MSRIPQKGLNLPGASSPRAHSSSTTNAAAIDAETLPAMGKKKKKKKRSDSGAEVETPNNVLSQAAFDASARLTSPGTSAALPALLNGAASKSSAALGPVDFKREVAAPTRVTLEDGTDAALLENGDARVGGDAFGAGLPLETLLELDISARVAPLQDKEGRPAALFRTVDDDGEASFRFALLNDGVVPHTKDQLLVHENAFYVVGSNGKVSEANGRLAGFLRDPNAPASDLTSGDDAPLFAVKLRQGGSWRRQLEKSTRSSVLQPRKDANPNGTTIWENFDGWVVHPEFGALTELNRGHLFVDEDGRAFHKERLDDGKGGHALRIEPAADHVVDDNTLVKNGFAIRRDNDASTVGMTMSNRPVLLREETVTKGDTLELPMGAWGPARTFVALQSPTDDGLQLHEKLASSSSSVLLRAPTGQVALFSQVPPPMLEAQGSPDGTFVADDANAPSHLVEGGALSKVLGQDGNKTLLTQREGTSTLETMPSDAASFTSPKTPVFSLRRDGKLSEVVVGTRRFGLLPPDANDESRPEQVATELLDALSSFAVQPGNFSRHQASVLGALATLLDDDAAFDGAPRPDRKAALKAELIAGEGPLLQLALGDAHLGDNDAMHAHLDAASGYANTRHDAFVYGVEGGTSVMRQRANGFTTNARAHGLGLFRKTAKRDAAGHSVVRPATTAEVKKHFDDVTGGSTAKNFDDVPKADAVSWNADTSTLTLKGAGLDRVVQVDLGKQQEGHPAIDDVVGWIAALPLQSLHALERIEFGAFDPNGQAQFSPHDGTLRFNPSPLWDQDGQGASVTLHEVAGHGIEQGNPHIYRLLMEARVLDGALNGNWAGTDDAYGDTNLAESFAVGVQEFAADPEKARAQRPHFAQLLSFLLTDDGAPLQVADLGRKFVTAHF